MASLRRGFGHAVRRLRIGLDLSQEKLAQKARVSRNFAGSVERGESSLSLDVAARFAKALGVTLTQLIAEAERTPDLPTHAGRRVRRNRD